MHAEARVLGLDRAKAVAAYLAQHGVLRQQMRSEAVPPAPGDHGVAAVGFVVVQSIVLPKRLAFDTEGSELPPSAPPTAAAPSASLATW